MPPGPIVSCPTTPASSGHPLVDHAALELAGTDRTEDEVGALERVLEHGRRDGTTSRSPRSCSSPSSTGVMCARRGSLTS